jgi:hypothetical protein
MVVTIKGMVFWVVTPCTSETAQCFRGTCRLHHQGQRLKSNVGFFPTYTALKPKDCTLQWLYEFAAKF